MREESLKALFAMGLVLSLAATGTPQRAWAQSIAGQVRDETTQGPVAGVTVTLLDSAGTVLGQQVTEADGRFAFVAGEPGQYRLRFQVPGYSLLVTPLLALAAGEQRDYPLTLRAVAPALLDTLLVEGSPVPWNLLGFYERRKRGLGYFATREDWNRWAVLEIRDVVRRLNPFLRPGGGGCSGWPVFVDGMRMPSDFDTGDLFLDNFAAIEVHRSPTVPPEFDRPFGVCGATALWSRLDLVGSSTHLDLGAHLGTAVAGAEGGRGRVGVRAVLALSGVVELHAAWSGIVSAFDPASVLPRTGWELIAAFRARPLGQESGWYVGLGGRAGGLNDAGPAAATEEQHFVVLSGIELPVGRLRPFLELQVLGPFTPGSAVLTGFVGVSARVY